MSDKIEFENGSIIESIKVKGKITRSSRADEIIYLKELFIVNYKYRLLEILDSEYETDTILIKAWDNKDVHKYMDKFREEFISWINKMELGHALDHIWGIIREANQYIENNKPWELKKIDEICG